VVCAAGEVSSRERSPSRRPVSLLNSLEAVRTPRGRLLETRRMDGADRGETIVFEVDVEVGQKPVHDIRPVERVAVTFLASDLFWPEVLALRSDFHAMCLHLFSATGGRPASLCLYEDNYGELKLRWTAVKVVERVDSGCERHRAAHFTEPINLWNPCLRVTTNQSSFPRIFFRRR